MDAAGRGERAEVPDDVITVNIVLEPGIRRENTIDSVVTATEHEVR